MKFEWNKVTWYSKIVALLLFVALPFIGFWYGMQYGGLVQSLRDQSLFIQSARTGAGYYSDIAAWQVGERSDAGFAIAYPLDFETNDIYTKTPSTDWRVGAGESEPGHLLFTLTVPRAFEPQTNFGDAKLTVGYSADAAAVAGCLTPDMSAPGVAASSTMDINGTVFTVFHSADAGAGNYYETTSYRTVHAGKCWAVGYTIHSSQIANYPASYGLHPFDRAAITDVLDRIVGTFKLL